MVVAADAQRSRHGNARRRMCETKGRFTKHKDAVESSGPTPSTEAKGRQTTRRWRVRWEEKKDRGNGKEKEKGEEEEEREEMDRLDDRTKRRERMGERTRKEVL